MKIKRKINKAAIVRNRKVADAYSRMMESETTRRRDVTRRENGGYMREIRLTYEECSAIYSSDGIARNAVNLIVNNILKKGVSFSVPDNTDLTKQVTDLYQELKLDDIIKRAVKDALVCGHSLILLVDKTQKPSGKMSAARLKGRKPNFVEVDGRYIATTPCIDILDARFNTPTKYFAAGVPFDPSFVANFNAIDPTSYLAPNYKYMGMSYYEAAYQAIINDQILSQAIPNIVYRSSISNYKITGMKDAINSGTEDDILRYISAAEDAKSVLNCTVIDADDTLEVLERQLAGLEGLDQRSVYRLAAAYGIAATILLGKSPDGQNATGDKDIESFYNFIEEWQKKWLPQLRWIYQVLIASLTGRDDINFELNFNKVNMTTPSQKAEMDAKYLENVQKMIDMNLPETVINRYMLEVGLINEDEADEIEELKEELSSGVEKEMERGGFYAKSGTGEVENPEENDGDEVGEKLAKKKVPSKSKLARKSDEEIEEI